MNGKTCDKCLRGLQPVGRWDGLSLGYNQSKDLLYTNKSDLTYERIFYI